MRPILGAVLLHEPSERRCAHAAGGGRPPAGRHGRAARPAPTRGAAEPFCAAQRHLAARHALPHRSADQRDLAAQLRARSAPLLLPKPLARSTACRRGAARRLGRCGHRPAWAHGGPLSERGVDGGGRDERRRTPRGEPRGGSRRPRRVPAGPRRRVRLGLPQRGVCTGERPRQLRR